MFARHVTMKLNPKFARELPRVIENEIIPVLKKQAGFLEQLVLISPAKVEAVAISLWEGKDYADKFEHEFNVLVGKLFEKYTGAIPMVQDYDVAFATIPAFEKLHQFSAV